MYCLLTLAVSVALATGHTLFDPGDARASENADVRFSRRAKRYVKTQGMPRFFDLTLKVDLKNIKLRLEKYNGQLLIPGSRMVPWAGYSSKNKDIRGIFLVQHDGNGTGLAIEGYLVKNGSLYLLQPMPFNDRHVIYKMNSASSSSGKLPVDPWRGSVMENLSKSRDKMGSIRNKRSNDFFKRQSLMLKLSINYDKQALEMTKRKFMNEKDEEIVVILEQFSILIALFVEECIKSLKLKMVSRLAAVNVHYELDFGTPGVGTPETVDGVRTTQCGKAMILRAAQYYKACKNTDHGIFLTGMGAERDFQLTLFSPNFPRYSKHAYIMSPYTLSIYEAERFDRAFDYSPKTSSDVYTFLRDLPSGRAKLCLLVLPHDIPKFTLGGLMDFNAQCQLALGVDAVPFQRNSGVCSNGIECGKRTAPVRIMPMPGTKCSPTGDKRCRWNQCKRA